MKVWQLGNVQVPRSIWWAVGRCKKLTTLHLLFPGIVRRDSSEDELDESTVGEEVEEKGKNNNNNSAFRTTAWSLKAAQCRDSLTFHLLLTVPSSQKTFSNASSAPWSSSGRLSWSLSTTWRMAWTRCVKTTWTFPKCCALNARCSASSKRRWADRAPHFTQCTECKH